MTVGMDTGNVSVENVTKESQVAGSVRFDWAIIAVSTWLVLGGYSDAWAHNHVPSLETFFTPWHGVLYAGLLVTIIFLVGAYIRNRRRGYSWNNALPPGYGLSLIGVAFFAIGGVGDLIWHTLFGIELNIDGALSPTHLLLTSSLVLIVSGPYRAAWHRSNGGLKQGLLQSLPMLLSLTYMLSIITLIAQIAHPFVNLWPSFSQQDPFTIQALAVVSILLQTIILMGLVLLTIRRWTLPFGFFTLLLTLNITLLSFMQDTYVLIIVAVLGGLCTDALYAWLKPSVTRPADVRLFAFIMPVVLYLLYFLALKLTTGVNWTIHLWLGTTFVAGIAGFLLSFLLVPPELPEKATE
jgi:hypothetical protein